MESTLKKLEFQENLPTEVADELMKIIKKNNSIWAIAEKCYFLGKSQSEFKDIPFLRVICNMLSDANDPKLNRFILCFTQSFLAAEHKKKQRKSGQEVSQNEY